MDKWYGLWSALTISRDLLDAFECTDGEKWGVSPLTVRPDEAVLYGTDKEAKIAEREKCSLTVTGVCRSQFSTLKKLILKWMVWLMRASS